MERFVSLEMSNLKKPFEVELLEEAEGYILKQNEKIQKKFLLAFDKTERK